MSDNGTRWRNDGVAAASSDGGGQWWQGAPTVLEFLVINFRGPDLRKLRYASDGTIRNCYFFSWGSCYISVVDSGGPSWLHVMVLLISDNCKTCTSEHWIGFTYLHTEFR